MVEALGTIISTSGPIPTRFRIYSGVLDYYDDWFEIDDRIKGHHEHLSPHSEAFGNDIVNMATYSFHILHYLDPKRIRLDESVIVVGGATEAFLYSLRSACDSVAEMLAYVASMNRGQVSGKSLKSLIDWVNKNPRRVRPELNGLLDRDFQWFFKLRSLRDQIAHHGVRANIHCDGYQFNLWMHSHKEGWKTRTPLLPMLADSLQQLLDFADDSAEIINSICSIPKDRRGSRAVSGVLIPNLHKFLKIAHLYNRPSS